MYKRQEKKKLYAYVMRRLVVSNLVLAVVGWGGFRYTWDIYTIVLLFLPEILDQYSFATRAKWNGHGFNYLSLLSWVITLSSAYSRELRVKYLIRSHEYEDDIGNKINRYHTMCGTIHKTLGKKVRKEIELWWSRKKSCSR